MAIFYIGIKRLCVKMASLSARVDKKVQYKYVSEFVVRRLPT